MKIRQFKLDEWVEYCQFPNSTAEVLKNERIRAVILEVLEKHDLYDYRIFIDDGSGRTRKVKEENLFPCNKTK
tara:strand:+ start:3645 stop:3863 length:219 start_codon:yes stop_codon:yes gene_type:complete